MHNSQSVIVQHCYVTENDIWRITYCFAMAFENIKDSIIKINTTVMENCFRLIMEKMQSPISITQLQQEVRKKDDKIHEMQTQIETLEQRVRTEEQYSSQDTIIVDNRPIYDPEWPLIRNVLHFFVKFL